MDTTAGNLVPSSRRLLQNGTAPQEDGGNGLAISTAAIVGISIGLFAFVKTVMAIVWWWWKYKRNAPKDQLLKSMGGNAKDIDDDTRVTISMGDMKPGMPADIPGLVKGEVFTRATAFDYKYVNTPTDSYAVVAGENDAGAGPAVQLTKDEVAEQIQLCKDGLVGRGATALVFKCMWPSKFGPNALLAAKVLKDGYEMDQHTLQSFAYEAAVLASLNPPHPNVVRLYGYCLDAPTVCLILELLPTSLKDVLYQNPQSASTTVGAIMGATQDLVYSTQNTATKYVTSSSKTTQDSVISAKAAHFKATEDATVFKTAMTDGKSATVSSIEPNTETDVRTCVSTSNLSSSTYNTNHSVVTASSACKPPLTMRQVLQIAIDIAAGLRYLHDMPLVTDIAGEEVLESVSEADGAAGDERKKSRKIVHRDLKPANILLDANGRAKISDFGLARQQMNTTMVTEHVGVGTLPYMGPELIVGRQMGVAVIPATNRVDIYSMAMIMWEMLAGRMPWNNLGETNLLAAVLTGRRPEMPSETEFDESVIPKESLSNVPASLYALPELNAIIRACWQQREHRRPTAAALHDMLVQLLDKHKE